MQEDQLILGPVVSCTPDELRFLRPVTLSVPHSGINISQHCLQVWCKSKAEDAVWEKLYDGLQNYAATAVRVGVSVEENRIKLRVDHFTDFSFTTTPISKLWNWLNPPEQLLEILAYMDPAEVATSRHVCVRVYAIKTTDAATRKVIEKFEDETGESGMCSLHAGFVLKADGKNLSVVVKITPGQQWRPVDTIEGCIPYTNIQNGGQANNFPAARREIGFQLPDGEDRAHSFIASFDVSQEKNAERAVKGIFVTDRKAQKDRNRNRNRNTTQDTPQAPNIPREKNERHLAERQDCLAPKQPPLNQQPTTHVTAEPGASQRNVGREKYQAQNKPQIATVPQCAEQCAEIASEPGNMPQELSVPHEKMAPFAEGLGELALEPNSNSKPLPNAAAGPGISDGGVRRRDHQKNPEKRRESLSSQSLQENQQSSPKSSNGGASSMPTAARTHYSNEARLWSIIEPCGISLDQSTAASPAPKQVDGDCGPLFKRLARDILIRWRQVAKALEFTPEQCEEFESNNTITEPWWPAYRMLLKWKDNLPKEKHEQFFKLLYQAIHQAFADSY